MGHHYLTHFIKQSIGLRQSSVVSGLKFKNDAAEFPRSFEFPASHEMLVIMNLHPPGDRIHESCILKLSPNQTPSVFFLKCVPVIRLGGITDGV